MFPAEFFRLAVAASRTQKEVTLIQLFSALELDGGVGTLDKLNTTREALEKAELCLIPDLTKGEITTERVLFSNKSLVSIEDVLVLIEAGESGQQELKSSLFFDRKRYAAKPDTPLVQLQSEAVTHASLKTIAAFMNSEGGRLILGASDEGDIYGIEDDFNYCQRKTNDSWELKFRDLIKTRFYEGDIVNNFVFLLFQNFDGHEVCVASIARRSRLTFLRGDGGRYCLFIRQGNRTIELGIEQIEEFLEDRIRRSAGASKASLEDT